MNWRTISGLQFFEDYVLPTTSNTKNPLYRAMGLPAAVGKVVGVNTTIESLCKRIRNAYLYGSIHAVGTAVSLAAMGVEAARESTGGLLTASAAGVLNAYCVALQVDIVSRIKRILAIKARRKDPPAG